MAVALADRFQKLILVVPALKRVQGPGGWQRLVVVALFAYLLLFAFWQLLLSSRVGWAGMVDSISPIFSDILLIALLVSVVRRAAFDPKIKRAWLWILIASSASLLGNVMWSWYELVQGTEPFPSWADAAYILFYPAMLIGLLYFPVARRMRTDRITIWLDTGIVSIASFMAIWYFVLGPTLADRDPDLLTTMLSVAYPAGDLLLLFAVVRILLRGTRADLLPVIVWIMPAVLTLALGDLYFAWLQLNDLYVTGHWVDITWVLSGVLIAVSAYVQHGRAARTEDVTEEREIESRLIRNLLPYGAMALGYGLLLVGSLQGTISGPNGLVIGTIALSGLVVARQIIAFSENQRLLARSVALGKQLQEQESQFRSLVQHGSDIILLLDAGANIRYISPSILRVTGVPPEGLVEQNLLDRLHPEDRTRAETFLQESARKPGFTGTIEVRVRHAEGSWLHVEAVCSNQLQNPSIKGIVINARDINDRKMLEARLVAQANSDDLTRLPNRKHFIEMLEAALKLGNEPVGVLFLDLDGFKEINDSLGHSFGDELLVALAKRLAAWSAPGLTPARLGGDEFTVLVTSTSDTQEIRRLTGDVQRLLDQPYRIGEHIVTLSPSIGIAMGQPGVDEADDVLRRADIAMYQVKAERRALRR